MSSSKDINNVEDLREEILNLNKQLEASLKVQEGLNNSLKEKEALIADLNNSVSDLKSKNYDLFVQVSNKIEEPKVETKEDIMPLSDIINSMIGDE